MVTEKKPKSIILYSLKEALVSILRNKLVFILLIFIQLIYIISLIFFQINYQIKIIEGSREIMDYFQSLNLDESQIMNDIEKNQDILGNDPLAIYLKFKELVKHIAVLITISIAMILFFNTLLWGFTERLLNKIGIKMFFRHILKLFLLNLVYLVLIGLVLLGVFQKPYLDLISKNSAFLVIPALLISIIIYFMLISLSLSNHIFLGILKNTFYVGIRKAHYSLGIYILSLIILLPQLLLLLISQRISFVFFPIILLIFLSSWVFCRIFIIILMRRLVG